MSKHLRVALAQINTIVGNIPANLEKHIEAAIRARDELDADLIVFPELSLCGYPPDDLLLRKSFIEATQKALEDLMLAVKDIHCLVGHPHATSQGLQNVSSLFFNQLILSRYAKQHLPNYGVFDEARYFIPGTTGSVISIKGVALGITICEDLWFPGPISQAASLGARIIISPNASPFEVQKHEERLSLLKKRAMNSQTVVIYTNCVGAQDDLVFDGGSMVINESGEVCLQAPFFTEAVSVIDVDVGPSKTLVPKSDIHHPTELENIYHCLVLGLKDYIEKNGFSQVFLGLSGGIDSALTLAIAVDALGPEKVRAIMMPSRHTADISIEDAKAIAKNFNVSLETLSIEPTYESFLESLAPLFKGTKTDVTEENIQSRCRGVLLMALSNKFGGLVLTTGNRSELAVGYSTLYGDMAGGFAVLKDVPKTLVYRLAEYRNHIQAQIPKRIITRAPSAELAPNQKDEDNLPPYEMLDQILEAYIDHEKSVDEIIAAGFNSIIVKKIVSLIQKNEYKRKQSPIGTRIHHKAFSRDRRYPNTNGFTQ